MFEKLKKLPMRYSMPLLVVFIGFLYFMLNKGVVPFTMKMLDSDIFFNTDEEKEELGKINNERSNYALAHCKSAMKEDNEIPETAQFDDSAYEAWALGGRTYVIRSHVMVPAESGAPTDRKFACKIKYDGGDTKDISNWSVLGVDFNEPGQ